jgi:hypothetical protein
MIADLLNVPQSLDSFGQWSFANQDHHMLVVNGILSQRGTTLTQYQLDPIPQDAVHNWLQRHQQAHNDINAVLGVQGNDISDIDFENLHLLQAWVRLHFNEHIQWSNVLGVF